MNAELKLTKITYKELWLDVTCDVSLASNN